VKSFGIRTIRIAARWHLIESSPGAYDFRSLEGLLDAADANEVEVVLDVLHFGWPDHIDVLSMDFANHFAKFTCALSNYLTSRAVLTPFITPVNEISYVAWAGGEKGCISPFVVNRGDELKRNLVRAAIAASRVLLNEIPGVRLISPEPAIHIVGNPDIPGDEEEAAAYTAAQYQSWDMLSGALAPELGGRPEYLDLLGVNFYARNEWSHNGGPLSRNDHRFRAFRDILSEIWTRYRRQMFIAETGTEDEARSSWFRYVCDEVWAARSHGIPILGICLYPVLNHAGWDDDRHCYNGLFDYPSARGEREVYEPLAEELLDQQKRFAERSRANYDEHEHRSDLLLASPLELRVSASSASDESLRPPTTSLFLRGAAV